MHVIIDLYSYPSGVNGMPRREEEGYACFYNNTALEYSYGVVDAAIGFIRTADNL